AMNGDCLKSLDLPEKKKVHLLQAYFEKLGNFKLVDGRSESKRIGAGGPVEVETISTYSDNLGTNTHGTGLMELSEIAFDKGRKYAVLKYDFTCGNMCGHGGTI